MTHEPETSGETNFTLKKKKLLTAMEAKRAGKLAPEEIQAMNLQLLAARRPALHPHIDSDPSDPIILHDFDPTDDIWVWPPL